MTILLALAFISVLLVYPRQTARFVIWTGVACALLFVAFVARVFLVAP